MNPLAARAARTHSQRGHPVNTPASVPPGLSVTLHRARVKPGRSEEADEWMRMLNDRLEETRATLDRERMAVEIIFRLSEDENDYLYWVTVKGEGGVSVGSSDHALDRDHLAYDERVRERGWTLGTVELLLMPPAVLDAVLNWAAQGNTR